jgi:hypothetical protein
MDVTLSLKPLAYPLHLEPGFSTDTLSTIGEAATFIKALGIEYDRKLHWSFAGTCLVDATRRLDSWDAIRTATEAMENALKTEGMLRTAR